MLLFLGIISRIYYCYIIWLVVVPHVLGKNSGKLLPAVWKPNPLMLSSGKVGLPLAWCDSRESSRSWYHISNCNKLQGWRHVSQSRDMGLEIFLDAGKWEVVSGFEVSILTLLPQNLLSYFDTLNFNYEDEKIVSSLYPESYEGKFLSSDSLCHQEL